MTQVHFLTKSWEFRTVNDTLWMPASVPGNVHMDLKKNKRIPDPFVRNNELQLQWISETDWEYQTDFQLDEEILGKQHIRLNFDGLDTYTEVYVNDSLVLKTDNAFRPWQTDIKSVVKEANNLRILFKNPTRIEEAKKNALYYELPEGNRVFTRKPQFHYGWDWGPVFITSGIWRPVYLESWDELNVEDVFIRQDKMSNEHALLTAEIPIESNLPGEVTMEVTVNGKTASSNTMQLVQGKVTYEVPFEITNPQWWWTHNLGTPYLYNIGISVFDKNKLYFKKTFKKGLRTIELVNEEEAGRKAFYFKLNGIPVFMKGANYIPQSSFQSEVSVDDYEQLIKDVVAANMNMLRVWGGGIYEEDVFYDLCDEQGVLVWQDFMFACAMYPGDQEFLNNVEQEAVENVRKLRNHCSIALWCGNNESAEGWDRWGWQAGKSDEQKSRIWKHYEQVFREILPKTVEMLGDGVTYWESSPKYGRGDARYLTEGDAHDWWVWHDAYPFEHFEEKIPLFMSEFGFQAFPSFEAIKYAIDSDSITVTDDRFRSHQKHPRGFQLIREYMERDFPVPDSDEDYVYVSQLLQAYGIGKGMEAHRRAMPSCMGSLYWQLNDCWPVVSWAGIDGLGNWKALHHRAQDAFAEVLISPVVKKDSLQVWAINDKLKAVSDTLLLQLMDFSGEELWTLKKQITIPGNSSVRVFQIPVKELSFPRKKAVLVSSFQGGERTFYFDKPKNLELTAGRIQIIVKKVKNGFQMELLSAILQKDVMLYSDAEGRFDDNFFDLLPNVPKTVFFKTDAEAVRIHTKTLNNIQ